MLTKLIKQMEEVLGDEDFEIKECSPHDVDRFEKIASDLRRQSNQYVRGLKKTWSVRK